VFVGPVGDELTKSAVCIDLVQRIN